MNASIGRIIEIPISKAYELMAKMVEDCTFMTITVCMTTLLHRVYPRHATPFTNCILFHTQYLHSISTLNIYTQYLHSIFTLNIYTQYLHSIFTLNIYTQYLHSISTLNIYTQYLHSIFTLNIYTQYLHSIFTLNIYTQYLILYSLNSYSLLVDNYDYEP